MLSIFQIDEYIYPSKSQSSQNSILHYWCRAIDTKYVWIIQFIQMTAYPLDKQRAGCNLSHDWLMSLAMDLTALCDMWR